MTAFLAFTGAVFWIVIAACIFGLLLALTWQVLWAVVAQARIAVKFKHPYFSPRSALWLFAHGSEGTKVNGYNIPAPWQSWESVNQYDEEDQSQ